MTNFDDDKAFGNEDEDDEYNSDMEDRLEGPPVRKKTKRLKRRFNQKGKVDKKLQRFKSLEQVLLHIHASKLEGSCPRYVKRVHKTIPNTR